MKEREQLLDRMIHIYGFEHKLVIEFASMIEDEEKFKTEILETLVKCHEKYPQFEEEIPMPTAEDLQEAWWEG